MWKFKQNTILALLAIMLLMSMAWSLIGCTRAVKSVTEVHDTVYVASHDADSLISGSVHTDTIYMVRTDTVQTVSAIRDSVLIRDSVFVREKGDTIFIYKERWRERTAAAHDTIYKVRTDTVLRTRTDTVRVLRYIERADTSYMAHSGQSKVVRRKNHWTSFLLAAIIVLIAGATVWWVRRYLPKK